MQPMQLTQHQAGFKYPKLNMGDGTKPHHHIRPGEHFQGKIVDIDHTTFPARGNQVAKRATIVSVQVTYARINTALVGGTFCFIIEKQMREAFLTARYGKNDFFGVQYEGLFPTKNNPAHSYHKYIIEGQKTPESQEVPDDQPAPQQQAQAPGIPQAPAPGTPQVPGLPQAPVVPAAPMAPQAPAMPQAPAPQAPPVPGGYPAAPAAPVPPAHGTPAMPAVPQAPVAPQAPMAPQAPAAPMAPQAPATPNMPTF